MIHHECNLYETFIENFRSAAVKNAGDGRRIGSELKFPLVNPDGSAASMEKVDALWEYLCARGWRPVMDGLTGKRVGAQCPGRRNNTLASCETGYCKTEFSMAHVGNLHELATDVETLRDLLRPFCDAQAVSFLGYGIQPLTPPGKHLLMKKGRAGVWDKVFPSNRHIPPEDGDDVHLFTVNAASHVHVSVSPAEAIDAVNVLNGFSAAQTALTANSSVWKGAPDTACCVSEMLWDLWMDDKRRVGMPEAPFKDMDHYIRTIADFKPVFVMREQVPVVLPDHESFHGYFTDKAPVGYDMAGRAVPLTPEYADFDVHCTCYWYNARISRYFTVENRVNDQQPPEDLMSIPALTLGLISALPESVEEIAAHSWQSLRRARVAACRQGLKGNADASVNLRDLARAMLELATLGLERRALGEAQYLAPLKERLALGRCPAEEMHQCFLEAGMEGLVARCRL